MKTETKRVPTNYAVSREQKRYIAKCKMKEAGIKNFCKHSHSSNVHPITGVSLGTTVHPSYFAEHWREYKEAAT